MGQGTDRVIAELDGDPRRIEGRLESLRHELGDLVGELDRRRHEALDVRLQVRRHPLAAAIAGVLVASAVGALVAWTVRRRRVRERPVEKARRARLAMQRLMDDPEHLARESTVGEKILAAAGTAAASLLVKRALDQVMPARR
jgi:hypothetical protein